MKIIIAPDSYKDNLSALAVAQCMEAGLLKACKDFEIIKIPIADGGEGTVEAILAGAGGKVVRTKVTGPLRNEIDSFFGILDDGKTAVIEMSAASGLELVPFHRRNPMNTTTYGTGELILAALDAGCTDIIIGVGGSSTNDGGMGMAQALGVVFFDKERKPLSYGGRFLNDIAFYDDNGIDSRIKNTRITVACDVTNPLYGENGAAYVYASQKGASQRQIRILDEGLKNFAKVIKDISAIDIGFLPGSGAAGGLAGGLVAFTGAKLKKGIDIVIEICNLHQHLENADLILTGEGKTDAQTAYGKVPVGIAKAAKKHNVPVICISGSLGKGYENVYNEGIDAVFSICPGPIDLKTAFENAETNITYTTFGIARLLLLDKFNR